MHGTALLVVIVLVLAAFETWRRLRHRPSTAIIATLWRLRREFRRQRRL
jgi:hypothetical protein